MLAFSVDWTVRKTHLGSLLVVVVLHDGGDEAFRVEQFALVDPDIHRVAGHVLHQDRRELVVQFRLVLLRQHLQRTLVAVVL